MKACLSTVLLTCVLLPIAAGAMPPPPGDSALVQRLHAQMEAQTPAAATRSAAVRQTLPGHWVVELGAAFLDAPGNARQVPASLDERLQALRTELMTRKGTVAVDDVQFVFAERSLEAWFGASGDSDGQRVGRTEQGDGVLVAAGHGHYYHQGFSDWRLQRPWVHGMVEDLVTPRFAARLADGLAAAAVKVHRARSTAEAPHPEAAKPWWTMAARYHIQAWMPEREDIWQSWEDRTAALAHYNDDIRSRPLLANALGVQALIHLHTNAAASPQARGMIGFYQPGREADRHFGHVLLCAVREALRADPIYADYRVDVQPRSGNYGENRLAQAPSLLVELGFHTNAEDAAALQDAAFQQHVADGLQQGYLQWHRLGGQAPGC